MELYFGLYALGNMLDMFDKDSVKFNMIPVTKKIDLSLYATFLTTSILSVIFSTVLIVGTTLVNNTSNFLILRY